MDIKRLKTFVAVYEESSFIGAALRLNLTQPGVSIQISALETEVGSPLFERRPRSVEPTALGERLYGRAVQLLRDFAKADADIKALVGKPMGRLVVGVAPVLSTSFLGPVLYKFSEQFPNVDITVTEACSDTLTGMLRLEQIDLAVAAHPPGFSSLDYEEVYRDRFVIVSGPKANLPKSKPVQLHAEPNWNIVMPAMRHGLTQILKNCLETKRIVAKRIMHIDSLHATLALLKDSDWVTLVPLSSVHAELSGNNLQMNTIAGPSIDVGFYIVSSSNQPLSDAATAFASIISEEFRNLSLSDEDHLSAASGLLD